MKNPKLIVKPFAKNGQKNAIPENYETSMDSNQATWDQGFGQITMLPVAAGGLPPKGQDFNGILNQISENIVYQSQGGRFKFSPEYAESIGGYPKGAILQSDDEKKEYQSLIDNNKVNFNTTSNISASWELVGYKYAIKTEVDLALLKKFDKENVSGTLGNDNSKVPSLNLLTTEVGKLQPKGNYQPAGDYATNEALNDGLDTKLNASSVVQSTGASTTQVMSQKAVSDKLNSLSQRINDVPVDQIFQFETTTPPAGYIERKGQAIDKDIMPKLYARYGANMPDDRDRVLRMAGELAGTAGSTQEDAIRNITGKISGQRWYSDNNVDTWGAFFGDTTSGGHSQNDSFVSPVVGFDASRVVPTASENRVKSRIIIFCNKIQ